MIQTEKNMKHRSSYLPISIGWVLKIGLTVAGFCIWGIDFIWVVLGLVFCWNILKSLVSCLISLICLIGFFYFLFTHIF